MKRSITNRIGVHRIALIVGTLCIAFYAASAKAEERRTWVSANGDDMSPLCSQRQPCRTFFRAIQATDPGGEVNCLNSAEYASRTTLRIDKSITIDCEGSFGAVLGTVDQAAIQIAGPKVEVTLRNLTISGDGKGVSIGVNFSEGAVLNIENCKIFGFQTGIAVIPETVVKVFVENTTISKNDDGVRIAPRPLGMQPIGQGGADVAINKTRVLNNNSAGILADSTFGRIKMAIMDSEVSGNAKNGIQAKTTNQPVNVRTDRIMSVNNDIGVVADGNAATVTMNHSMITGNRANVAAVNNGHLQTYKTNSIDDNTPGQNGMLIIELK